MKLSFHGADHGVTGSCHMIEIAGKRILIDCGLYQGNRELDEENADDFGFDPRSIDYLLLTHAHLDHCGRIPLLVKRGFTGEIIATSATRDLARIVMLDAAHLHEEEASRHARHANRRGDETSAPLYEAHDAFHALDRFGRKANYDDPIELAPTLHATFHDAGHILGSASIRIEDTQGSGQSIIFSGDLGNSGRPILRNPQVPPHADVVVMETTYGDRLHKALAPSVDELHQAIADTFVRGGNVVIPTFALERAQEILFYLREGIELGRLPRSMPVFLDSPMAISATQVFSRHPECFSAENQALFANGKDPFMLPGLRFTRDTADSMAINRLVGGAVIMAGAGMCTGGRVRHHLRHNIWRRESSVVFVGFAAKGTLAREIVDGAKHITVFGEKIPVRAHIHTINGFSAHADRDELLAWQQALQPAHTVLVHGDEKVMQAFASLLKDTQIHMPKKDDELSF